MAAAVTFVDADAYRSASHRNMIEHLTAPLQAGAVDTPVGIDAGGNVAVTWRARLALLLVAPLAPLDANGLRVTATVPGSTIDLDFAPFTEAGAFLAVFRPDVDDQGFADTFTIKLGSLREISPTGEVAKIAPTEIANRLEARLLEGNLGRMTYLLGAEKQRLRRLARELTAMRRLDQARDNALDRLGAELGVPRFADTLAFRGGEIVTDVRREPDPDYRRRLGLYRPWLLPTRKRVLDLLNGPGAATAPNAGPLGDLGVTARFSLVEEDNDFAVAITIVGVEDASYRAGFFQFVRAVHLILPRDDAASNAVHDARFQPPPLRARDQKLREDFRQSFNLVSAGADVAVAPMLAAALNRAGACRSALAATTKWKLLRAQNADAGSRYELGLGADLDPLSAQDLDDLVAAHANRSTNPDPEIEGLLASMTPQSAADDPDGRWLLEPCGLKTVHRVDPQTLYVSHLPILGLAITGPPQLQPAGWTAIVTGRFVDGPFDTLLFYESATGSGLLWRFGVHSGPEFVKDLTGLRTTWTTILAANITPGDFDDLLFYERSTGTAELYSNDGAGNLALVKQHQGLRTTWTAIVAGTFHAGGANDDGLFFYDGSAGVCELYRVDAAGNLTLLGAHTDVRRGWTQVVAGRFTDGPLTDLLFYDRVTGDVEIYATDGAGGLRLVRRTPAWELGWTNVIAASFGAHGRFYSDLFVYNRDTGAAEFHATDGDGNLYLQPVQAERRQGWTRIVAGRLGGRRFGGEDLLFYDRATGAAEVQSVGSERTALLRTLTGQPHSSGQLYEAQFRAPGDAATNVVLVRGLAGAAKVWAAAPFNGPAWTVLSDADAQARWQAAVAPSAATLDVFRAAGLPAVAAPGSAVEQLLRLPPELVSTIRLDTTQAGRIIAGGSAPAAQLRDLTTVVRSQGIASALAFVTGPNEVVLVLGAIGLPQAGINLSDRRSSGFRWYLVPIQGPGGDLSAVGSRTSFTPSGAGVYALVVVGYARGDKTDPYEFRVEVPADARVSPIQYEFLMNVLEQTFPVGVTVNTYDIRHDHVDLDGDGNAEPLTPAATRTYRAFRRPRHRGEVAVTLDES
jgi:hypothetical protein